MRPITTTDLDDLDLARLGDAPAFERLVRAHHGAALALACRITGSLDDGEDAMQDALLKTWHGLPDLRAGARFRPWFLRIVYRQCLDHLRRRKTRRRHEATQLPRQAPSAGESAAQREQLLRVTAAMEHLPPRQLAALQLRVHEQLPYDEIGSVLGLTPRSARETVVRARRRLVELLGGEG